MFLLERHGIEGFLAFYANSNVSIVDFAQTPKISTYLFALCAGNFAVFSDNDGMYPPQRIFIKKSLALQFRSELIFCVSKQTINFYQQSFGVRYPFSKLDHVMCPDYKHGAMENVACITYSDSLVSVEMTDAQTAFLAVVIQHELCHMWFGNLVTMQWWDDLWLNEAFATALSYRACSVAGSFALKYLEETQVLFSGYKRWGLAEDMRSSCHPIVTSCTDTEQSEQLLDGISYGKGSALINQLIHLIGWDQFT
jgi:aminopeptidase N